MRAAYLLVIAWGLCAAGAQAQIVRAKKKEDVYDSPMDRIAVRLKRGKMTDEEFNAYMWTFARQTRDDELKLHKFARQSEEFPFWARRNVWAAATMPQRAATFGVGKLTSEARQRPTLEDRIAASRMPESAHSTQADDDAILAAAYRHFFDYRVLGFGSASREENAKMKVGDVYFLGTGPHISDAPSSLLAALQNDPDIKRDKVTLRPLTKVLEVTAEAIRDRDTGAYGPAFRVDDIGILQGGEVKVMVTFTEREGFWFTRELTLRQGKTGWEVARDTDYALR